MDTMDKVKFERNKCAILCPNCHALCGEPEMEHYFAAERETLISMYAVYRQMKRVELDA